MEFSSPLSLGGPGGFIDEVADDMEWRCERLGQNFAMDNHRVQRV